MRPHIFFTAEKIDGLRSVEDEDRNSRRTSEAALGNDVLACGTAEMMDS